MDVSAHRAFTLLRELAYERVSCSEAETKTAYRLQKEAQAIGAQVSIEEFTVPCGKVNSAKFTVLEPYQKEYQVTGYERSDATPAGGLTADFKYVEEADDVSLQSARGKIVLVNGRVRLNAYERLQKAGVAGIVTFSGTTIDRASDTDTLIMKFRETLTERHGFTVGVNLRAADAAEIVRRGATKVKIEIDSQRYDGTSRNVCAVLPGARYPEEIVSFGAHYDSVYFSTGVYDNMSGSVILMELLRYFQHNPPARTLRFNWYGSEEQGLLGSKAWTRAHEEELDKHVLMINVDVAAATLGKNIAPTLATEAAVGYVDAVMREIGVPCETKLDIYSSDCIPFADHGVPAVNFCRFGAPGANYIHDRRDNLKSNYVDERSLDITLRQALAFSRRVIEAAAFPIRREICPEIRNKVDEYLFKKEKKAE